MKNLENLMKEFYILLKRNSGISNASDERVKEFIKNNESALSQYTKNDLKQSFIICLIDNNEDFSNHLKLFHDFLSKIEDQLKIIGETNVKSSSSGIAKKYLTLEVSEAIGNNKPNNDPTPMELALYR